MTIHRRSNSDACAMDDTLHKVDEVLRSVGLTHGNRGHSKKLAPADAEKGVRSPTSRRQRIEVLRVGDWARFGWLQHGFSTRTGGTSTVYRPGEAVGELNLGFTAADDAQRVHENRRIFLAAVSGKQPAAAGRRSVQKNSQLVALKQIHSSLIRRVGIGLAESVDTSSEVSAAGDGLMTNERGVILGILTADCIPILIADKKKRAVAAFHAGWRGTLKRIVESGVGRMRLEFGSKPEDLVAAIGPGIGSCCYAVGEEIRDEFDSQFHYALELFREVSDSDPVKQKYPMLFMNARAPGHGDPGVSLHLDLAAANRRQLMAAGLKPKQITMLNQCTSCAPDRFFSHRQQQGFTGRMMAVIGLRP